MRQEDDRAGIADARLAVLDLVDERDRDVVLGKDVDRLGQGAHAVGDLQAHIVLGLELVHGLKGEVVTIGLNLGQRSHAAADLLGERQDIAHDGARGGEGACAGTVEHGLAHGVAYDVDSVHGAVDLGEHVIGRDQRGMHADVDAGVGVAGDAEQLNGVAELAGLGDVLGADGTDTLLVHIIGGHAGAKADGGEDRRLAGGVEAVDVGGRVGLGVALGLGVGEHVGVIGALGVHARQDVVGGAVENAGDGQDLVAHQVVLERAHDGDAAAAAGLALNLHAACARLLGERLDMTAQQGLVGRDDVLAVLEGGGKDLGRGVLAADQLDDDVDGGVGDDVVPVTRKGLALNACRLGLLPGKRAGAGQLKVDAVGCQVLIVVALDQTGHAAADGSQTDQTDVHGAQGFAHR